MWRHKRKKRVGISACKMKKRLLICLNKWNVTKKNNVFLKTIMVIANMIVNQITILQMIMTLREKKKKKGNVVKRKQSFRYLH